MPILDVELVERPGAERAPNIAQRLADELSRALGAAAGRVWVKLRVLDCDRYAENDAAAPHDLPVFVTVLHAHPPTGPAQQEELRLLTQTVANVVGRPTERVHVQYAPPAAGRQAFGGTLVE